MVSCHFSQMCESKISDQPFSRTKQALFVFDYMTDLPDLESLLKVLKSHHVHIIVLSKGYNSPDRLIKEIDRKLVRGCSTHEIVPLTRIHSTQRIVHRVMKYIDFAPTSDDQRLFEQLAEFTTGSPLLVNTTAEVLFSHYKSHRREESTSLKIVQSLYLKHTKCWSVSHDSPIPTYISRVRSISRNVVDRLPAIAKESDDSRDIWETDSMYDSWDSIVALVSSCGLSLEERLLLNCLSALGYCPVPLSLVTEISSVIAKSVDQSFLASTLYHKLMQYKLMKPYPLPVVSHPHSCKDCGEPELVYMYIPQLIAECLWNSMGTVDRLATLSILRLSLSQLHLCDSASVSIGSIHTFCSVLVEVFEKNFSTVGKEAYQELINDRLNCQWC